MPVTGCASKKFLIGQDERGQRLDNTQTLERGVPHNSLRVIRREKKRMGEERRESSSWISRIEPKRAAEVEQRNERTLCLT